MNAAYKVKYKNALTGERCLDAIVAFSGDYEEDIGTLARAIKKTLEDPRPDYWEACITSIKYIGPWYKYDG